MDDPFWISHELANAIHNRQLSEHGGIAGTRDEGLLLSALSRPRHQFAYGDPTPSLHGLAAAYAFGIAKNHPFLDGNKRTAYVVCRTFLVLNGLDFTASREERYIHFLSLAAGELTETELTTWLQANTAPL